jgi:DNA-directed RNA polymerase specialized sigma24 family protein
MTDHTPDLPPDLRLLDHVVFEQDRAAFFALIDPYLGFLRRQALHELAIAEQDGELHRGEVSAADLVDEVVAAAYDRFDKRERPLERWLVSLLHETVDRRESETREATSIEDASPARDSSTEPDDEWAFDEIAFQDEVESAPFDETFADPDAVKPDAAAESNDERHWLVDQLRSFPLQMRRAFVLQALEGFRIAEISQVQHRSERSVAADIEAVRRAMRARLER